MLYNSRSYLRYISPYFEHKYKDLTAPEWENIINDFLRPYLKKWERLADVMNSVYNPIENYNRVETETIGDITTSTNATTQADDTKSNATSSGTESQDVYGFNSDLAQPSASNKISNSGNTSTLTNTTINSNGTDDKQITRNSETKGNIGVTTTQQMIEQELELRKKIVIDYIFQDVDNIITLDLYDI